MEKTLSEKAIDITIDATSVDRAVSALGSFGTKALSSIRRALNRAIAGVRKDADVAVREVYNVKSTAVRKSFFITNAGSGRGDGFLSARAESVGRKIALSEFGVLPRTASRKRMPEVGASVEITRGSRKTVPGAFVGSGKKSGKKLVFKRKGSERHPVVALTGPSVPQMLGAVRHPDIAEDISTKARERFEKNLTHEIDYVLKNMGVV